MLDAVRVAIRDVPDFPKPGIVFKDITPILADPRALQAGHRRAGRPLAGRAGATRWSASSRAASSSPRRSPTRSAPASPSSASRASCPGRPSARPTRSSTARTGSSCTRTPSGPGERVLVVDDVLATGGTAEAVGRLVERQGAELVGYSFVVELGFLGGAGAAGRRTGSTRCCGI